MAFVREIRGSRRAVLVIAISAIALETALLGLIAPLLPEIEERTGAGDAALGLALAAYAIPILLVSIPVGRLADRIGRRPLLLGACAAYIVFGYPFFLLASSGSVALAILCQFLMVMLYAPFAATCASFLTEITATRVRYTAMSIGYNIAVAIFGGFAPFIATWLVRATGSPYAPSLYVIAAAVITGIAVLRTRETAFQPLR